MNLTEKEQKEYDLAIPTRRFYGEVMQVGLNSILIQVKHGNDLLDQNGHKGRRVMGYGLPEWQRDEVWSKEQSVKFIESIYMGVGIGTYMVNSSFGNKEMDHMLLDGQQRLIAIEKYMNGDFPVVGADGIARCYPDLHERSKAHFLRINFPYIWTKYDTEEQCREAYNRHNFGGTVHRDDQRA